MGLKIPPISKSIQDSFQQWLNQYGYLSEVGTDIAVPRWQDEPLPMQLLLLQLCQGDRRSNYRNVSETLKKIFFSPRATESKGGKQLKFIPSY